MNFRSFANFTLLSTFLKCRDLSSTSRPLSTRVKVIPCERYTSTLKKRKTFKWTVWKNARISVCPSDVMFKLLLSLKSLCFRCSPVLVFRCLPQRIEENFGGENSRYEKARERIRHREKDRLPSLGREPKTVVILFKSH